MSPAQRDELMVRYLEGIASDAEVAALEAGMLADRGLAREFVRLAHLQALFADLPPASAAAAPRRPRWRGWALAGATAAALAVAVLRLLLPPAATGPTISALSGTAEGSRSGRELVLLPGGRLCAGDRLVLAGTAELTLAWPDGTAVILAGGSRVSLGGEAQAVLTLAAGMLHASVVHDPRRPFAIATPDAQARDIGTEFTVQADAGGTSVRVEQGLVALANSQGAVAIAAGTSAHALSGQAPRLDVPAPAPAAAGGPPAAAGPAQPAEPGALSVSGTVTAIDGGRHSFTLADGLTGIASEYRAYFAGGHPEAMMAQIARLRVGDSLTVTYVEKEGRRAVRIMPGPAPAPAGNERRPGQF